MLRFAQKVDGTNFLDTKIAQMLLKPFPDVDESVSAFLCYLSAAVRRGHLCVRIGDIIAPDLNTLDMEISEEMIRDGSEKIPSQLLEGPLHKEGDRFYFQRYWQAESHCKQLFQSLLKQSPTLKVDEALVTKEVENLLAAGKLQPEQGEAISSAARNSLTLLSGGPGTGKTYTIGHLLRLLQEGIQKPLQIALAAPTGKAAIHLEKSLSLKAMTLHALLGIREGQSHKPFLLSADLVIVDECSMIDLKIMNALLGSIKPGARLILVGDQHQLAPVESGTLFSDLVAYCKKLPNQVELKTCLRTEVKSIVTLADAIQAGRADQVLEMLETHALEGISYHPLEKEESIQRELVEAVLSRSSTGTFRLLSPLRKGPLGVDALNRLCAAIAQKQYPFEAPIILTRSDRRLGLFNGEMGQLVRGLESEDYVLFPDRRLSAFLLPPYEYAYCLSVYKSQGSEFDEVWVVLPEGSEHFGREVLYTAVSRARKKVHIWGSKEVIRKTVERQVQRLSGICS